jgi:hypothetical protein
LSLTAIDYFSLSLVLNISGFFALSKGEFLSFSPKIAHFSYIKAASMGLAFDLLAFRFMMYANILRTGGFDGRTDWGRKYLFTTCRIEKREYPVYGRYQRVAFIQGTR